jgi:hypothetical protein
LGGVGLVTGNIDNRRILACFLDNGQSGTRWVRRNDRWVVAVSYIYEHALTRSYSYDTCDIGTLPNQTYPNGTGPISTLTTGDNNGPLSFLPGQRYSACTCPGEDHPGPNNGVGRAAPEIDLIEAQIIIDLGIGEVSQSNQIAPYDAFYQYNNASIYCDIEDLGISKFNSYKGGIYQEAVSVLTQVPSRIYRDQVIGGRKGEFATFELEWLADFNNRKNGFITWAVDGKRAWTMRPGALAANPLTEIGDRIIAEEPMYMIFNYHMVSRFEYHPVKSAYTLLVKQLPGRQFRPVNVAE